MLKDYITGARLTQGFVADPTKIKEYTEMFKPWYEFTEFKQKDESFVGYRRLQSGDTVWSLVPAGDVIIVGEPNYKGEYYNIWKAYKEDDMFQVEDSPVLYGMLKAKREFYTKEMNKRRENVGETWS